MALLSPLRKFQELLVTGAHTHFRWTLAIIEEIWTRNRRSERWQFRLFQVDFRS